MNEVIEQSDLEKTGSAFTREQMLAVRDMTRAAIHAIAGRSSRAWSRKTPSTWPRTFSRAGMLRGWHDVYVRFGTNTTKTFGAASDPGIVLGEDDIFFIDIGPVFEKWEGDGGDTFLTGADPEMARCADDARKLFHIVRKKWETRRLTGKGSTTSPIAEAQAHGLGAQYGPLRPSDLGFSARGRSMTARWPTSTSRPRRCSGSWKSISAIPTRRSAPSTRTCCSTIPTLSDFSP